MHSLVVSCPKAIGRDSSLMSLFCCVNPCKTQEAFLLVDMHYLMLQDLWFNAMLLCVLPVVFDPLQSILACSIWHDWILIDDRITDINYVNVTLGDVRQANTTHKNK